MDKRKFGMSTLDISQGRFHKNGLSHANLNAYDLVGSDSGIDNFYATYNYVIVGVLEYSKTGFANTIMYYDKENDITLALTHANTIPGSFIVGKKFEIGELMYYEGTKGKATGNHIHMEIGKGKQTKKYKINGMYQMKNLINIEEYFYIDPYFTKIEPSNASRPNMANLYSFEKKVDKMIVNDGFNKILYKNQTVNVYKQRPGQEITLINTPGDNEVMKIDKFIQQDINIHAAINCSYFIMSGKNKGTVLGREQGLNVDARPSKDTFLDFVITKDNRLVIGDMESCDFEGQHVKVGASHAVTLRNLGVDAVKVSSEVGNSKWTNSNTQTILGQDNAGILYMVVVSGKLNGNDCLGLSRYLGLETAVMLDSGGSSQMMVDGQKQVYTGRELPNILAFYTRNEDTSTPVDTSLLPIGKITVVKYGLNIRRELKFTNRKNRSTTIGFIPKGESAEIIDFIPGLQSDGFQWCIVKCGTGYGYCQYDSAAYYIEVYK